MFIGSTKRNLAIHWNAAFRGGGDELFLEEGRWMRDKAARHGRLDFDMWLGDGAGGAGPDADEYSHVVSVSEVSLKPNIFEVWTQYFHRLEVIW